MFRNCSLSWTGKEKWVCGVGVGGGGSDGVQEIKSNSLGLMILLSLDVFYKFVFNLNTPRPLYNTIVGVHSINRVN